MAAKKKALWQVLAAQLLLVAVPLYGSLPELAALASARGSELVEAREARPETASWASKPHVRASSFALETQPLAILEVTCEIASGVCVVTDDAGLTLSKYEWGPDRLLSLNHATEGRTFHLFDGLGSVVALTRLDGGIQTRYLWDAWGNLRSQVGDSENLFGFTGYEKDDATGLYYAKARFYDPELGRFLNEDPFGGETMSPPSLHRFLYAYVNPTVYWDPDGRDSLKQAVQDYATEAYGEGNWFEKGIAFLGQTAYAVAEAASVGAVGRIGNAQEQLDRGEITKDQYWQQTGKAVVKSGAVLAVGATTGGVGALVARGAGAGATSTAVISGTAAGLGAQAGGDLVEGELSSAQDYAIAGGLGAAGGLAARGVQALKANGIGDMTVGQAAKSVASKVKSFAIGESSATGGAEVGLAEVIQSTPAVPVGASKAGLPARPSWQAAQASPADDLAGLGFEAEPSYIGGKRVPYGTKGSVRPDYASESMKLSAEVKNYNVTTPQGRWRLVSDVVGQTGDRALNLPQNMRQGVIIDIRGQEISDKLLQGMLDRIVKKSNGLIQPENIHVRR